MDLKDILEKALGFEINKLEVNPKFEHGKFTGLDIFIEKNRSLEYIENKITILKSSENFYDEDRLTPI